MVVEFGVLLDCLFCVFLVVLCFMFIYLEGLIFRFGFRLEWFGC